MDGARSVSILQRGKFVSEGTERLTALEGEEEEPWRKCKEMENISHLTNF